MTHSYAHDPWFLQSSCVTHEWVMSHTWMHHVTHMKSVVPHTWMRHVARMNASSHAHGCVMSHAWMRNITHVNVSRHVMHEISPPLSKRDATHSHVWHDTCTCVTWRIYVCETTHSYTTCLIHISHVSFMCHDSITWVTWIIDIWHSSFIRCDMTHSYTTCLIHISHVSFTYDTTYSRGWHDALMTWFIHKGWYDSFARNTPHVLYDLLQLNCKRSLYIDMSVVCWCVWMSHELQVCMD